MRALMTFKNAVALTALGVVAAGAIMLSPHDASGEDPPTIGQISAQQAALYPVLNDPAPGYVPPRVAVFDDPGSPAYPFGANPELARTVHPGAGDTWWVVPGQDTICFYSIKGAQGACSDIDDEAGSVLIFGVDPNSVQGDGADSVQGLVPDQVDSAVAVTTGGDVAADVSDNVLQVHAQGIESIELKDADAQVLATVPAAPAS